MKRSTILVACAVLALPLALGACRKEEQNRLTHLTPGVYQGKKGMALSQKTLTELRARVMHQRADFSSGGGTVSPPDVRPPENFSGRSFKARLARQNY